MRKPLVWRCRRAQGHVLVCGSEYRRYERVHQVRDRRQAAQLVCHVGGRQQRDIADRGTDARRLLDHLNGPCLSTLNNVSPNTSLQTH